MDRQEILDCINSYARGLDRLDADLIRAAFHTDAIDNHGPFVGGREEFVKFAIDIESSFFWTHHGVTTHNCEVTGDVAHAESYVHFFVQTADRSTVAAGGGRYLDKLERREGRWALSLRKVFMDWSIQVPYSSWLGPDWEELRGRRDKQDDSYQRPLSPPSK
jgi:hypothetical protein